MLTMPKILRMSREKKNVWVMGLSVGCPMRGRTPGCPCHRFESIGLGETVRVVESLTDEEIDDILITHRVCLEERENHE